MSNCVVFHVTALLPGVVVRWEIIYEIACGQTQLNIYTFFLVFV